jgi:hypothetical protein
MGGVRGKAGECEYEEHKSKNRRRWRKRTKWEERDTKIVFF